MLAESGSLARRNGRTRAIAWLALAVPLCLTAGGGCSDDTSSEAIRAKKLSEGCIINSDCSSDLKCAWQRCHTECETSKDCHAPLRCVAGNQPYNVCQLQDETDCSYNSQCPEGQLCATDGQCRDQCIGDRDCVSGQVCVSSVCAEPTELENGKLPGEEVGPSSGRPCRYHSECPDPLFCRNGYCGAECLAARDCAAGQDCISSRCTGGSDGGGGSGGADSGSPCTLSSECASGELCIQGRCSPECVSDVDCPQGETCRSGDCEFDVPVGAPSGYGDPCALTSECTPGLICASLQRCIYECRTGADCAPDFCCSSKHTCVTGSACLDAGPGDGGSDASDGATTDGPSCVSDQVCQDQSTCNGAERCSGGTCQAPSKALCDDNNPCTDDMCAESTGACSYVQRGPQDADGDGHYAVQCGNGADDCDDTNRDVHAGHVELCDQIDNNCDGAIDEGRWTLGTPVSLPGGNLSYPTHDIARLSSGGYVVSANDGTNDLKIWQLSASLAVTAGPATGTGYYVSETDVAVGQGGFAIGSTSSTRPRVAWAATTTTPTEYELSASQGRSPAVAYNGSEYLLAWTDARDGAYRIYVSTLSASGVPSASSRLVTTDPTKNTDYAGYNYPNHIAVGTSTALVAWTSPAITGLRYAVLTKDFGTTLATPPEISLPAGRLTSAVFGLGSFWLVWEGSGEISIHRVDAQTGAAQGSRQVEVQGSQTAPQLATIPGGFLLALNNGITRLSVGFVPEDSARPVTLTDFSLGAVTLGEPRLAVVDAKRAVMAWKQDTVLRVAELTCGP